MGQLTSRGSDHAARLSPALMRTVPLVVAEFGMRELAGTAHGLARAGLGRDAEARPLWLALTTTSIERLHTFSPRELSTLAWSLAKAKLPHADTEVVFDAIAFEARPRLSGFSPQGLSNLVWAYATAGHSAHELFAAFEPISTQRVADFNTQELANIAWAFAQMGRTAADELFVAIAGAARAQIYSFATHELAMLGWACAVVDAPEEAASILFGDGSPFVRLCEDALCESAEECAVGEDRRQDSTLMQLEEIRARRRSRGPDGGAAGSLTQLHQWSLWRVERGERWDGFSPEFAARCCDVFFAEAVAAPSTFELDVQAALARMGLRTRQRVRTPEGYVIDLHVESSDGGRRRIAIEVDGPWRFISFSSREATGPTLLKRRQLRHFGSRLMSLPYWEWEDLSGRPEDEQRYLTLAIAVRTAVRLPTPFQSDGAASQGGGEAGEEAGEEAGDEGGSSPLLRQFLRRRGDLLGDGVGATWTRSLRSADFGEAIELEAVCDTAAAKRVVFFGEVYAQPSIVQFEAAILGRMLEQLAGEGGGEGDVGEGVVYVVLEHFSMEMQPLLDRFMSLELSFDGLVEEYTTNGDEGHDLQALRPLLVLARDFAKAESSRAARASGATRGVRAQLIGGFVPRRIARLAVASGLDAALDAARSAGFVSAEEDCSSSDDHYAFFEALCSGRRIHDWKADPSGLARRLFPAQVIKGCSMAHAVSRLVDDVDDGATEQGTPYKVLVCCGASHMAYGFGVPERAFAAHPALRDDSYRIYAYETDAERTVLTDEGLRDVFGASSSTGGVEVADVAFVYDKPSKEE